MFEDELGNHYNDVFEWDLAGCLFPMGRHRQENVAGF